jgi:flagellar biosynthesis/type III secretory pathway M-ring protein FliF/YscJ
MVVLAVILLVLVAVLVVAIFVSNPDIYELSIFGAVVPVTSAGVFITGAVAMAVTILALLLLRTGIRRGRARRKEIKALQTSSDNVPSSSAAQAEDSSATTSGKASETSDVTESVTAEPSTTNETSSREVEGESSTTPAARRAMLEEADALTRDEPQK